MSNNKRNGGIFGKGYYIALILCAAAIGITGYVYNRNAKEPEQVLQQDVNDDPQLDATLDNVQAVATQPQKEDPSQSSNQPTTPPTEGYEGRYYIASIRSSGNYFYMSSDLGTASTKRYQAVDSGLTTLPASITATRWQSSLTTCI